MSKNLFITGTDTDVGKTYVTGLIVKKMISSGFDTTYFKAAASGNDRDQNGALIPGDAALVQKLSGIKDDLSELIPYVYEVALSPHLASQIEGNPVDLKVVKEYYNKLARKHHYITMEGSGGILCPINMNNQELWQEDIIKAFDMACVIVANAGLGTINHTVLTIEYMRQKNMTVKGIILNHFHPGDRMEEDNADMIEHRAGLPILCRVQDGDTELKMDGELLASFYRQKVR
ncbi:MAG: dethiobiotin synthase [Oscillospiraceae bacterium]|jgi:dethiobiotin synthetase|nr:ATP-dependent dethiobiotin synthetase BioD [Ruminococcaceae bacterium BL-4]